MNILFISPNVFPPQKYGGIEVATLDLCEALHNRGHTASIMAGLASGNALWLINRIKSRVLKQPFPKDRVSNTNVYRGWEPALNLNHVIKQSSPDAVVIQARNFDSHTVACASVKLGLPTFYYVHDVSVFLQGTFPPEMERVTWIANSNFTARELFKARGITSVTIPVLVLPEVYKTNSSRRFTTMINPRPMKGGHIALQIAELCPDIPFLFVEAWESDHPDVLTLKQTYSHLSNITWLSPRRDMQAVYSQTKVLLAPSQCEETWGRVVTEAQFSGIPALVSEMGALPETAGAGGITAPADASPSHWADLLRSLWNDTEIYNKISSAALKHVEREEVSTSAIIDALLRTLTSQPNFALKI